VGILNQLFLHKTNRALVKWAKLFMTWVGLLFLWVMLKKE